MRPKTLELRIERVVWQGHDAPSPQALAAAVQDALQCATQERTRAAAATPLQRAADAIAQQVLQRLD